MNNVIFIDTDCGIDDAAAIMIALGSGADIRGISCTAGNTGIDNVVNNVCGLLSFCCRPDIPVYRGASQGLLQKPLRASDIHGAGGLGGAELAPVGKREELARAAEGLYAAAEACPGLRVVALAPLTNIAMAVNLYPRLRSLVGEIVAMGGAVLEGNVTPYAEFNFASDPEAAAFCLASGIPMRIVTWDAVMSASLEESEYEELGMEGSPAGRLFRDIQRFYIEFKRSNFNQQVITFPDPLAMTCALEPSAVTVSEKHFLRIDLDRYSRKRGEMIYVDPGEGRADGKAEVVTGCSREILSGMIRKINNIETN